MLRIEGSGEAGKRESREAGKQGSRKAGKQGAFITNLLLSLKRMVFEHKVESVMFY